MRKMALAVIASLLLPSAAAAQVRVNGYVTKNGTYVAPYYRSAPNSTKLDNYSTQGNINPYTGKPGTVNVHANPYNYGSSSGTPSYGSYGYVPYGSTTQDGDDDPE